MEGCEFSNRANLHKTCIWWFSPKWLIRADSWWCYWELNAREKQTVFLFYQWAPHSTRVMSSLCSGQGGNNTKGFIFWVLLMYQKEITLQHPLTGAKLWTEDSQVGSVAASSNQWSCFWPNCKQKTNQETSTDRTITIAKCTHVFVCWSWQLLCAWTQ